MQYDLAYTRFGKIITAIYDAVHYMLFDISYWWWATSTILLIVSFFFSLKLFVYETSISGRLGSGSLYTESYPKENVNKVVVRIFNFISIILEVVFITLSAFFVLRLIIAGFTWLFSPIN